MCLLKCVCSSCKVSFKMLAVISSIVHSERSVIHLLYFSINNAALHPYLTLAHNALLLQ